MAGGSFLCFNTLFCALMMFQNLLTDNVLVLLCSLYFPSSHPFSTHLFPSRLTPLMDHTNQAAYWLMSVVFFSLANKRREQKGRKGRRERESERRVDRGGRVVCIVTASTAVLLPHHPFKPQDRNGVPLASLKCLSSSWFPRPCSSLCKWFLHYSL